jgi:hypothetical protein
LTSSSPPSGSVSHPAVYILPDIPSDPQKLKAALWYAIGKIVDEETLRLGMNATPQFIGALTELVWAQIGKCSWRSLRALGENLPGRRMEQGDATQ